MSEVSVTVYKPSDRRNLMMKCVDPVTGRTLRKSAGTHVRREAQRAAARWEVELTTGGVGASPRMGWEAFVAMYADRKLSTLRPATEANYFCSLNRFRELVGPRRLADLETESVARFAVALRGQGNREATVAKHLRHLRAAARWAHRQGLLTRVPHFDMPSGRGTENAKGRPPTGEEFDRLLDKTAGVVGDDPAVIKSWQDVLRLLWWSGLRLGEAMLLRDDSRPGAIEVRLNGKRSVLAFHPASQKSGDAELMPLAPEAVELLESLSFAGDWVLRPLRPDGTPTARSTQAVMRRLNAIGKASRIQVNADTGKTATAHDLRRAFGTRWAPRVTPSVLMRMMRLKSERIANQFYVQLEAEDSAEHIWRAAGHTFGHTPATGGAAQKRKTLRNKG